MINNKRINLKSQNDYIIIDIETTGLLPQKNEIIEIVALLVDGKTHQEKAVFTSLCKINKKSSLRNYKINRY